MKVMFVDDDFVEIKVLKRHFKEPLDFDIFYANSYYEAKEIVEKENIDLIFSDFNLGDADGTQFKEDFSNIKLYILSGSGVSSTQKEVFDKYQIELIDKDFNRDYLITLDTIITESVKVN